MTSNPSALPDLDSDGGAVLDAVTTWFHGPDAADGSGGAGLPDVPASDPRVQGEMLAYLRASHEQRLVVAGRLPTLVAAHFDKGRGVVARAASTLGTPRANVYRLLDRMEVMGPVSALVPQSRKGRPPSTARDGFGEPVDGWLETILALTPEASFADVEREVRRRAESSAAWDRPVRVPPPSSLKRRVHHLRARGTMDPDRADRPRPVGAHVLIDHCLVNLDVRRAEDPGARPGLTGMMVAVDEGTGLILGVGLLLVSAEAGYSALALDVARRLAALADARVPIGSTMDTVRLVVPDVMERRAEQVGSALPASRRPRVALIPQGARRGGARLVSRLGDRIGDLMLLTRSTVTPAGPRRSHVRIIHSAADAETATFIVSSEVDAWNAGRVAALRLAVGGAAAASRRNAAELAADVAALLAPIRA